MNAYKDRIAETERVKERKRARVERGAGDVSMESGNSDDEQVTIRHADASGGDIKKNQHEEDRMRDIHVGKRGSEAAGEEQPDKLRKTERFEKEASSSSATASAEPAVPLEYLASGETQDRSGSLLVQKSGHVGDDIQISALDLLFYEMDGGKSRYIREVLEWYGGEHAGDLKRSELNESVENMICLNPSGRKIWKRNLKIVMDDEIHQKIVMDGKLGQNVVMDGKFVKNFVRDAKIDPKVVMDLSIFKIGGWNSLQPIYQNSMEDFIEKNEPWLLIGIPNRDPFLVTQYLERHSVSSDQHMKKLMSLRGGLHVLMQCYMRQHLAVIDYMNIQEDMHRGENLR